jgi:precorrin-6A/cobalt-precorrin-6A reductase
MDSHRCGVVFVAGTAISETIMRVLILGGSTEASELARRLAHDRRYSITLSLAGRTAAPASLPVPLRVGGFGGPDGLAAWLKAERIAALIDATHPFARRISGNAVTAAQAARVPLFSILRPPWTPQPGDRWIEVGSAGEAAVALGPRPARVLLAIGRLDLDAFTAAPHHHYIVRSIDPPAALCALPHAELLLQRGPFDERAETNLMRDRAIDVVVSKNSGGPAAYPKIAAARALGLPVVMIGRSCKPAAGAAGDVSAALQWLGSLPRAHAGASSERGV